MKCFTTITLGLLCVLLFIESGLCRPENRDLEEEQNDEEGEGGEGEEEPNDQGAPDSRRPPIIKTQPMTITVEKGQTAILPCEFQDLGDTQTMWLMNSQQLFIGAYKFDQRNTRFNLTSKHEETGIYNLKITNVTSADAGIWTCKLLLTQTHQPHISHKLEVKRTPLAPVIQQVTNSTKNPWSNFKWKIVSSSPILEYELKYWKSTNPEKFHTVRLPVQNAVSGNIYELEHAIADVENTKYEVVLRAMNTYGWSKFSEKHYFAGVQSDSASPDVLENIKSKDGTGAGARSTISALVLLVTVVASLCC